MDIIGEYHPTTDRENNKVVNYGLTTGNWARQEIRKVDQDLPIIFYSTDTVKALDENTRCILKPESMRTIATYLIEMMNTYNSKKKDARDPKDLRAQAMIS
jgi:hypothetical protein